MPRNFPFPGRRSLGLAMAFVLCSGLPAYAVTPNVEHALRTAGQVNDSVKEHGATIPANDKVQIVVSEDQEEVKPLKEGAKLLVRGFQFNGIDAVSEPALREDKLQDLIKDSINQELTVSELKAVARRIAMYFQEKGYMVASAYIPAQKIEAGVVEITVLPGRYGDLDLRNHSRLSDRMVRKMLGCLKEGSFVKKASLERTLLLLSDTGGVSIKATLEPGKTTGTTTLVVSINNTDALTADLSMDNYGNRFTGQVRRNFDLDAHNVSGRGDQARLKLYNSGGGLTDVGIDYVLPVGGQGLRVGLSYEQLHYSLGEEFEPLDAYGTAKNTGVNVSYPLVRSRNYNLYATLGYTHKQLEDRVNGRDYYILRSSNVWRLGLSGDKRDNFHGGGINSFVMIVSGGHLSIDGGHDEFGNTAQYVDSTGPQTAGSFTKVNLDFSRLQYINDRANLYFGFSSQLASKNLDTSEKMYLGGAEGLRAYPQGEASGDQGYLLSAEYRYQTKNPKVQVLAFVDHGHVQINKDPWPSAGDNSRTLSGMGIGAIYTRDKQYYLRLDYAWKLGSEEAESDNDKSGRLWLRGIRYF